MRLIIVLLAIAFAGCHTGHGEEPKSQCLKFENSIIMYGAVPQLWGNGFKAVETKLDYLKTLGINTIWLWPPINRRAEGEEYAIINYFSVDPTWGSESDLKMLVTRAHRLQLKIILDFVPNHTSSQHPYYLDVLKKGRASPYYDFYDRMPDGNVSYYFNWDHLPNLNYNNPDVRRWITDAMKYWVKAYDIDGFRMDMAWAVHERYPEFWPQCCRELERIKPGIFMLAEAPASDPSIFEAGFDAAYDWKGGPGKWAWQEVFDDPKNIEPELKAALTNDREDFATKGLVLRFINNNDTGERFIERHGLHLTRSASAMQFTLPGIPVIFAGDEIGAKYLPSGEVEEIPWDDRFGIFEWYTRLITLRDRLPVLRSDNMVLLESEPDSILSYIRKGCGLDPVLVIINYGQAAEAKIQLTPEAKSLFRNVYDAANNNRTFSLTNVNTISVPIETNSFRLLVPLTNN